MEKEKTKRKIWVLNTKDDLRGLDHGKTKEIKPFDFNAINSIKAWCSKNSEGLKFRVEQGVNLKITRL
jgi:TusA-related sulfurtransferase